MLDHVADKFLLYATLIALVAAHKLYFFFSIIWIGREFFIMTLRQIALENDFAITVSSYGKVKTVAQMTCLAFIIANPYHAHTLTALYWNGAELLLLLLGTALSIGSAYNYFSVFMKK
jgi:phosphatidylglycerophosphate synthase